MKLKNKKTGEIGYLIVGKGSNHYVVANDEWGSRGEYSSLAELNAEWEDALDEERKDNYYWYIDDFGRTYFSSELLDEIEGGPNDWMARKLFGNYFGSKEEAKESVEKLKAWKRLKDKGFKFGGYGRYHWTGEEWPHIDFSYSNFDNLFDDKQCVADLDLLFGGEE